MNLVENGTVKFDFKILANFLALLFTSMNCQRGGIAATFFRLQIEGDYTHNSSGGEIAACIRRPAYLGGVDCGPGVGVLNYLNRPMETCGGSEGIAVLFLYLLTP